MIRTLALRSDHAKSYTDWASKSMRRTPPRTESQSRGRRVGVTLALSRPRDLSHTPCLVCYCTRVLAAPHDVCFPATTLPRNHLCADLVRYPGNRTGQRPWFNFSPPTTPSYAAAFSSPHSPSHGNKSRDAKTLTCDPGDENR